MTVDLASEDRVPGGGMFSSRQIAGHPVARRFWNPTWSAQAGAGIRDCAWFYGMSAVHILAGIQERACAAATTNTFGGTT